MLRPFHQFDRVFMQAMPRGHDKVAVIQAAVESAAANGAA